MSEPAPLPEWPAGRKHISVREVAELAAQWRYGPCADPPPPLAIDMSQCDFETVVQIYAMDHQARENHESVCRRRDLEIVTFKREILALASQHGVRLRRPTIDTPAFSEPDENFVLDKEGFRKLMPELLDPLGISDNSPDAPEPMDRSTVSESEPTAEHAATAGPATPHASAVATQLGKIAKRHLEIQTAIEHQFPLTETWERSCDSIRTELGVEKKARGYHDKTIWRLAEQIRIKSEKDK